MTPAIPACRFCQGSLRDTGYACSDRPDIAVMECTACGMRQLSNFSHIEIDRYESDGYFPADWAPLWEREAHWNERRIEKCLALLPDPCSRRMLDFGCGIGGFLRRASPHFASVTGFDLSPAVASRLNGLGFAAIGSLDHAPADIDTIALFHVLEHTTAPWSLLADLRARFPNVDRFVLETPNTDEALLEWFALESYRRNHYSAEHLWYFTNASLAKVAERAGLTIVHDGQLQRYQLGNTLGWARDGTGGGQSRWPAFNDGAFHAAYEQVLAEHGVADSVFLIASPAAAAK